MNTFFENPLDDIPGVTLETYQKLLRLKLLDEYKVRNHDMCRKYRLLRASGCKREAAIDILLQKYPTISYTTAIKIIVGCH